MGEPILSVDDVKSAAREQWDGAAAGWNASSASIHAWLAQTTETMLDLAGVTPGARVLDVAAGAGDQTLEIARRVAPDGSVLATDISPRILELAERNASAAGLTGIAFEVVDAEALDLDEASFDAAVCRLGLMLFPDPAKALKSIHLALKPSARLCAVVFAEPASNPCVGILMRTALAHAGLPPADPSRPGSLFSLGDASLLERLFLNAGFGDVRVGRITAPFKLPSVEDYLSFARTSAGPILAILEKLGPAAAEVAWKDIADKLAVFDTPSGWEGPNELLIATGQR